MIPKIETVITETDDGHGNIVQTETIVTRTYLYITVSHKTVDEMTTQYSFNQEQKDYLTELLKEENNFLWSAALYGIRASDDHTDWNRGLYSDIRCCNSYDDYST